MVQFRLGVVYLVLLWFGMIWFDLVWFDMIRFGLFGLFGLVWFELVWEIVGAEDSQLGQEPAGWLLVRLVRYGLVMILTWIVFLLFGLIEGAAAGSQQGYNKALLFGALVWCALIGLLRLVCFTWCALLYVFLMRFFFILFASYKHRFAFVLLRLALVWFSFVFFISCLARAGYNLGTLRGRERGDQNGRRLCRR